MRCISYLPVYCFTWLCLVVASTAAAGEVIHVPLKQFTVSGEARGAPGGVQYEMWAIEGLHLGTPPQPMYLTLDTGSSALVVLQQNCTSTICARGVGPRFNFSASSSYRTVGPVPGNCTLSYGAGSMEGLQAMDSMTLTASTKPQSQLSFAGVDAVSGNPGFPAAISENLLPSGLMGISPFSDGCHAVNFLKQLTEAKIIEAPILGLLYAGRYTSKGVLSIGTPDARYYHEPVVWSSEFLMPITNVTIDGRPAPMSCVGPVANYTCYAIPDTGGSYFSADIGFNWTIGDDCEGLERLPTLGVALLGLVMTFTPQDYVIVTPSPGGRRRCTSGLEQLTIVPGGNFTETPVPGAQGVWQFAGRFNSVVYNIVDMDSGMNGFALARTPSG
jgi:hypothetical protein